MTLFEFNRRFPTEQDAINLIIATYCNETKFEELPPY